MSKVFISYSRRDSDCVSRVVRRLEGYGYDVWFDKLSIPGGSDWQEGIREGVWESGAALVFWSENSSQSDYVKEEIRLIMRRTMDLTVIPVWMDDTSLDKNLSAYNAVFLKNCSSPEINKLEDELQKVKDLTRRHILPFQKNRPLKDHSEARYAGSLPIAIVPFIQSAHCNVSVFGEEDLTWDDINSREEPTIQLCIQTLGQADDSFIRQVYDTFVSWRQRDLETPAFFGLHITGKPKGSGYVLDNTRQGEWLDVVNTTVAAATNLAGRGGAILQTFVQIPAALAVPLGRPFYNFWTLQMYNYLKDDQRDHPREAYTLVLDTRDL